MRSADPRAAEPLHYALGALRFTIEGEHPVVRYLADEFAPLRLQAAPETPHIRFRFVSALPRMTGASHVPPLTIGDDRFALARGRLSYQVVQTAAGLDVAILPGRLDAVRRLAPDGLVRLTDWNHLTRYETIAKNFVYDVFDYVSQIAQLPLGQSHLHASSFERDGTGVAIIAWGGVGKTTAMLKLVLEDGWRYLSDDLVTVDRAGTLWRSPKRLQVYAYNVANEEGIRRSLMSGRSLADRVAWSFRHALRGPKRVRRRVSAEQLFGEAAAAPSAALRHAIYIERVDCRDFDVQQITVDQLARRATATVLKELHPFADLSLALHSGERHPVLPSLEAMHEATCATLRAALSRLQPLSVRIPLSAGPNDIANCVRQLVGGRMHHTAAAPAFEAGS